MVGAAGVEQTVIHVAWFGVRVEFNRAHGVCVVLSDVSRAQQFAARSFKFIGGWIVGVPFGEDVVIGDVFQAVADRDEVGDFGIVWPSLPVNGVEQPILGELRVKHEPDKAALQALVMGHGEVLVEIGVDVRLIIGVNEVQDASRIVGEAAPVWQVADVAHSRPFPRVDVQLWRAQVACIRKPEQILDLDGDTVIHDLRKRVPNDRIGGAAGSKPENEKKRERSHGVVMISKQPGARASRKTVLPRRAWGTITLQITC